MQFMTWNNKIFLEKNCITFFGDIYVGKGSCWAQPRNVEAQLQGSQDNSNAPIRHLWYVQMIQIYMTRKKEKSAFEDDQLLPQIAIVKCR